MILPKDVLTDRYLWQQLVEYVDQILVLSKTQGWRSAAGTITKVLREPRFGSSQRRFLVDALYEIIRKLRRLTAILGVKHPNSSQFVLAWIFDESTQGQEFEFPEEVQEARSPLSLSSFNSVLRKHDLSLEQMQLNQKRLQQEFEVVREEKEGGAMKELVIQSEVTTAEPIINRTALAVPLKVDAIGAALSYPNWLAKAITSQYGIKSGVEILCAQNQRAPLTIRANALKTNRENLLHKLHALGIDGQKTTLSPLGLLLDTRINMYSLPLFQEGLFELQDEGSQLIAELVAPPPGGVVIDACAGAGGKTLALGALMENKGRIYAFDVDEKKLDELKKRLRRAGMSNTQVHLWSNLPRSLSTTSQILAHRVLCDVPCSGTGVIRRNPESRWAIQPKDVEELKKTQLAILEKSAPFVRPGGRLIYSTCTLLREENEQTVETFLQRHPDFALMPVKEIWGLSRAKQVGDGTFLKLIPTHEKSPDGFFAAVLRRLPETESPHLAEATPREA